MAWMAMWASLIDIVQLGWDAELLVQHGWIQVVLALAPGLDGCNVVCAKQHKGVTQFDRIIQ